MIFNAAAAALLLILDEEEREERIAETTEWHESGEADDFREWAVQLRESWSAVENNPVPSRELSRNMSTFPEEEGRSVLATPIITARLMQFLRDSGVKHELVAWDRDNQGNRSGYLDIHIRLNERYESYWNAFKDLFRGGPDNTAHLRINEATGECTVSFERDRSQLASFRNELSGQLSDASLDEILTDEEMGYEWATEVQERYNNWHTGWVDSMSSEPDTANSQTFTSTEEAEPALAEFIANYRERLGYSN